MTEDHDVHGSLDALRAADRPRALSEEARRRVEARMLDAYEQAGAEARSRHVDGPGPVIDLEDARADPPLRPRRHRLFAAAAAVVALIAAVSLFDDSDGHVLDVAGIDDSGMDTDVVIAVRTWCRTDLGEFRAALDALDDDGTDAQRRVALDTLATVADGLFEILADLQIPDGARRLQEIGRLTGEAAVLRDGDPPITAADIDDLVARLDAELVLLSGAADACELRR